eukprot:1159183-Pelagomonas_calceolata.AAC.19
MEFGKVLPVACSMFSLVNRGRQRHIGTSFLKAWYEVQQGQPDAVRRVFLRAVRQCPGCKALWLEGLLYAAATPSPALSAGSTAAGASPTAGMGAFKLHPSGRKL